jgi:hypothetical protein
MKTMVKSWYRGYPPAIVKLSFVCMKPLMCLAGHQVASLSSRLSCVTIHFLFYLFEQQFRWLLKDTSWVALLLILASLRLVLYINSWLLRLDSFLCRYPSFLLPPNLKNMASASQHWSLALRRHVTERMRAISIMNESLAFEPGQAVDTQNLNKENKHTWRQERTGATVTITTKQAPTNEFIFPVQIFPSKPSSLTNS